MTCIKVSEPRTLVKVEVNEEESDDDDYDEDFDDEEEHDFSDKKAGLLSFASKSETVWVSNGEMYNIKEIDDNEATESNTS